MKSAVLAALVALLAPGMAIAQPQDDVVDDIVVTAQASGAPIWTIRNGASTLILVGSISGLPADVTWRPQALEAAVERADLALTPQEGRLGLADIMRVIWRMRTIGVLPDERTTADYLDADWQARLEAVMADERSDAWRRQSLLLLSFSLIEDGTGFGQGRQGRSAAEVVQRTARQADIETRPVGIVRGDTMVESLIEAPPQAHVACLQAAIVAAEAGPDTARERAMAWRTRNVAAVAASPIDQALSRCWPWVDADIAPELHAQWAETIQTALSTPQETVAVAGVRLLAEPNGILDQLEARGLEIEGPAWRPDAVD